VNAWLLSRREVVSPVRQNRRPTSGRIIVNGVTFVGGKR
jgi:hypothetical protein